MLVHLPSLHYTLILELPAQISLSFIFLLPHALFSALKKGVYDLFVKETYNKAFI